MPDSSSRSEIVLDGLLAHAEAANKGNYEVTKQYLSQAGLRYVEGNLGALVGGLKGITDKYARSGTLRHRDRRSPCTR